MYTSLETLTTLETVDVPTPVYTPVTSTMTVFDKRSVKRNQESVWVDTYGMAAVKSACGCVIGAAPTTTVTKAEPAVTVTQTVSKTVDAVKHLTTHVTVQVTSTSVLTKTAKQVTKYKAVPITFTSTVIVDATKTATSFSTVGVDRTIVESIVATNTVDVDATDFLAMTETTVIDKTATVVTGVVATAEVDVTATSTYDATITKSVTDVKVVSTDVVKSTEVDLVATVTASYTATVTDGVVTTVTEFKEFYTTTGQTILTLRDDDLVLFLAWARHLDMLMITASASRIRTAGTLHAVGRLLSGHVLHVFVTSDGERMRRAGLHGDVLLAEVEQYLRRNIVGLPVVGGAE
jgi:hypothetical protein